MSEIDNEFADFYAELEKNIPKNNGNNENKPKINKVWLNAPSNDGKMLIVAFVGKDKSPMVHIKKVKQIKLYNEDFDADQWYRILPKELLGSLTDDESALYDQVVSLHERILEEEILDNFKIKVSNYSLMYGVPLKHYENGSLDKTIDTHIMKPSMIIYPSANASGAMKTAIDNQRVQANGSMAFMSHVFNNEIEKRMAYVISSFAKKSGSEGFGYNISFGFGFDNDFAKNIPPSFTLTQEQLELFSDPIADFLGGMNGKDGKRFNEDIFKFLRIEMMKILSGEAAEDAAQAEIQKQEVAASAPEVKVPESVDKMLANSVANPSNPTATPTVNAPPPPPTS